MSDNTTNALAKVIEGLIKAGLSVAIVFLACTIGTIMGAVGGWVVGLFYTNTITAVLAALGVTGIKVWQLGAFLGFVSGFFRRSSK